MMMRRTTSSFKIVPSSFTPSAAEAGSASLVRSPHDTAHALFAPMHYERNYAYPLLVWLHGPCDDERQLTRIMPLVSMRNYVGVAPRGTAIAAGDGQAGYDWLQSEEHIRHAEQRIFESIEIVRQKLHVAPQRTFLAGFDSGGTMAFRVALRRPTCFAGVVSLCGAFPSGQTPLEHLADARRLPLYLAIGRDSPVYASSDVCEHMRLLHTAGMSLTLRQYPCGHELVPRMLTDINRWIMEQVTPAPSPAEANLE